MTERPLVSLCVIARDERERIARCIAAAAPLADEVVLADTGSRDETPRIAAEAGARVVAVRWTDDFSAARNACLDAARGEWALVVDADETLQPFERTALHQLLARAREPAFSVEIASDRGAGRVEVAHVTRLFRIDPRFRYEGRVHEQVLSSICRALGRETWTPPRSGLRLLHEGYRPELRLARGKLERNRALLSRDVASRPSDPGPRFLLARELTASAGGDVLDVPSVREARVVLGPAAQLLAAAPARGITDPALALAARLALACGDAADAAHWCARLRESGESVRWCYAEGERLLALALAGGAPATAAARTFEAAFRAVEGSPAIPAEAEMRGAWAAVRAAAASFLAGDAARAERTLRAVAAEPVEEALVRAWLAANARGPAAAVTELGEAIRAEAGDPRPWYALSRVFEQLGDSPRARQMLETALRAAPGWAAASTVPASGLVAFWQ
ncbi:MAG: glycosyltransferase [Acidobacteria bacterium]|nr:glycosyltransferase [Acidobacteriota bacterium]